MTEADVSAAATPPGIPSDGGRMSEVGYQYSAHFPKALERAGARSWCRLTRRASSSASVSSDGELTFSFRGFDKVMGVAVGADRIAVADKTQIWSLDDHSELAPLIEPAGRYDRCWLPRSSTVVGDFQCHEIAWGTTDSGEPDLWIVNTLFSCLAGLAPRYSFVPRWRPPFVSQLAPQDRCHLNGLAMREGAPVRHGAGLDRRTVRVAHGPPHSGAVLDVASGEVVTTGLSMPHSPRWHDGSLYVLNSGMGRLERVDLATGDREAVAVVPGYARGLALHATSRSSACRGSARRRSSVACRSRRTTTAQVRRRHHRSQHRQHARHAAVRQRRWRRSSTCRWPPGVRCPTFGSGHDDGDDLWMLPSRPGAE